MRLFGDTIQLRLLEKIVVIGDVLIYDLTTEYLIRICIVYETENCDEFNI